MAWFLLPSGFPPEKYTIKSEKVTGRASMRRRQKGC